MLKDRIRKYLPVVLDLETGGLDNKKNPILEIAIQLLEYRDNNFELGELIRYHIEPFKDLEIDPESLEFTKIDLSHPLRNAVEENVALKNISKAINKQRSKYECSRVILVAHNAHFDLGFLVEAFKRNKIKNLSKKNYVENLLLSEIIFTLNENEDFDIKFENKDTNFVKLFFMDKLLSTAGNGLTLTNGLYFILAFVSAIKFPYILKSLARMLEPYSTFGIRLCKAGLDI